MGIHVRLTADACADLDRYRASGQFKRFLAKLVRLEEEGVGVGVPLGRGLTTFRKIKVGDRDWRIIFQANADETEATVWVIADRSDEQCYKLAAERLEAMGTQRPEARSLAAILYEIADQRRRDPEPPRLG